MIRIRYHIGIGQDSATGDYVAFMESVHDKKKNKVKATKFAPLLSAMVKRLRKKERMVNRFPLAEETGNVLIIPPAGFIVPNGR